MKFKDIVLTVMTGGVYAVIAGTEKVKKKNEAEKLRDSIWSLNRATQKFNNLTDEEKAEVFDYINAEKQYEEAFKNLTE